MDPTSTLEDRDRKYLEQSIGAALTDALIVAAKERYIRLSEIISCDNVITVTCDYVIIIIISTCDTACEIAKTITGLICSM